MIISLIGSLDDSVASEASESTHLRHQVTPKPWLREGRSQNDGATNLGIFRSWQPPA